MHSSLKNLLLALLANISVQGADHDVVQVKSPYVVKHPLGPSMEVHRTQPFGQSTSFRESRNANFPSYQPECYSCKIGGFSSHDHSSSSHRSGGSFSGGIPGPVYPAYVAPRTTSSRQEFRQEQKFVNGQPVYDLHHERKYEDGRLVHEERREKDEDDFGSSGAQVSGISYDQYGQPGYTRKVEESRYESHSKGGYGYGGGYRSGTTGSEDYLGKFNDEASKLQETLRQQIGTYRSQPHLPSTGSSHRTEFHTKTRYVNGQPVYVKKEERKYQDGRLVHNTTEEKGAEDLGTGSIQQQYDSSGALYGGGSGSRVYESRQEYQESSRRGDPYYPAPSYSGDSYGYGYDASDRQYPNYHPASSSDSSDSSSVHSGIRPDYRGHRTAQSHSSRESSYSQSYPSQREPDSHESRRLLPSYQPYRPYTETSSSHSRQESSDTFQPSSSYSGSSTTSQHNSYSDEKGRSSSSYPSYRPASESTSTQTSEDAYRSSVYRPSSGSSSTQISSDSYRPSYSPSDGYPSSYPSYRPSDDRSTHVNSNAIYQESKEDYDSRYRPAAPTGSSERTSSRHSSTTDSRYRGQDSVSYGYPQSGHSSEGVARTVAIDLSSSSHTRDQDLSFEGHRPSTSTYRGSESDRSSGYGRGIHSSTHEESHSSSQSSTHQSGTVGIPGVIIGPQTGHGDVDYEDKERYDISPLDDEFSQPLPEVDNEINSSSFYEIPDVDGEIESSDTYLSRTDGYLDSHSSESSSRSYDQYHTPHGSDTSGVGSGLDHDSYLYNETHNIYGIPIRQPASTAEHTQHGYSHSSTVDESQRVYPTSSGSSHYRYNETRRHSTILGGHQSPAMTSGLASTSDCTQTSGCISDGTRSSTRRSEIRTSKRYINGELVGITHYERVYENGKLVHENVTEQGVDELTPQELSKYGIDQLNLVHGSYQPNTYSQRHEVKQEKKYVNGQQIYDLHHERRFEDGNLVHENRTEKDEDDFGTSGQTAAQLGYGYADSQYDGASRHEVRQSQHLQQQVTSDSRPGRVGQSLQQHEVADSAKIIGNPVYTTKRHETRRQQEYIDGQPVYDLHHERRYQDGSLVYENKTELDEKEIGGHYDALHQIMSGNTLNTAYQSSHRRPTSESSESQSYGSYSGSSSIGSSSPSLEADTSYDRSTSSSSFGTSSSASSLEQESSSGYRDSASLGGSSLLSGGVLQPHSGGAKTTVLGVSPSLETSGGESYSRGYESSYTASGDSSFSGGSSLSSGGLLQPHSGGARTTVLGVSSGIRGSSLSSGEILQSQGGGTGARTTVLGVSPGIRGSSLSSGEIVQSQGGSTGLGIMGSGSSSQQFESSYSASEGSSSGSSGCLSCVLVGGSGLSSHGSSSSHSTSHGSFSHGSGAIGVGDGYSQGQEMQREEYYEDGQLVHGKEENRVFRDGQLVQEDRRQYSGIPGQAGTAEALRSSGTSYASHSSSSSSESSSSSHSSSKPISVGLGVGGTSGFGTRVTVKGDTSGACDTNPCQNGGTCISGIRGPLCVCTFGFKGLRCEEVYCPRRFCRYGGTCSVADGSHQCSCKRGFSGNRCQNRGRQ